MGDELEPEPEVPFMLVRTAPVLAPSRCQGKSCGKTVVPPDVLSVVTSKQRFHEDPNGPRVSASLCAECVRRLGDKVETIVRSLNGAATPIPGPDVESF